jgi:C-terminal processing protease CtpA/Prc
MNKILAIGSALLVAAFTNIAAAESYDKIIGVGLGIEKKSEKAFVIESVVENSPAAKNGTIQVGNMITEIKATPDAQFERVYGKSLEDVIMAIRGEVGVPVGLKIYNPADHAITEVELVREELDVEGNDGEALTEDQSAE